MHLFCRYPGILRVLHEVKWAQFKYLKMLWREIEQKIGYMEEEIDHVYQELKEISQQKIIEND